MNREKVRVMFMKRLAIILSLLSILIGSAVSPAYSVQDKCLTTKKFKEVDIRTLQIMKKNLSKYLGQAFVLQAEVSQFVGESQFWAYWYGKGSAGLKGGLPAGAVDLTKNLKRISHLAENDVIKAKVILLEVTSQYPPVFSICSATIISEIK